MPIGPRNNVGCFLSRQTVYSSYKRITMHNQLCRLWRGKEVYLDLKLYLKNGSQMARTTGKYPLHFVKDTLYWRQV